jgi:hypothetical protein
MELNSSEHWTAGSIQNFTYRIAADFLAQVETEIESGEVSRTLLAKRLDRTPGRVSQLLNNPGNLTITSAVRLVRAAGMKVALVAYKDNDPQNNNGPINSAIFSQCWKDVGAPTTFFELSSTAASFCNSGILNSSDLGPINVANMTMMTIGNVTATTTVAVPINTSPLWAGNTGFAYCNVNGNTGKMAMSIEPAVFTATTATY